MKYRHRPMSIYCANDHSFIPPRVVGIFRLGRLQAIKLADHSRHWFRIDDETQAEFIERVCADLKTQGAETALI